MQWDPYNVPILTEKTGKIEFRDMIAGVTIKRDVDEATGLMGTVVIEHKEDLHPQIVIVGDKKEILASYSIPAGAHVVVEEGEKIRAGALLAKTPRKIAKTKDITGGLPRVAELFEARRPKDAAEIAKIDGIVEIGGTVRGKRKLIVKDPETGAEEEHLIPLTKHIIVFKGDFVKKGQQLTEGPVVPHEILEVCGPQDLQEHLVNEVQEVYRLQGVEINDKHIEIIVRQMLRKVKITDPGDTSLLWGDQIDRLDFEAENTQVVEQGGKPAEATPVLLGITKASLETDSFISARLLPGHDARPHRSGDARQGRSPPRLQGERHHGSPHSGRHRLPGGSRDQARGAGRTGRHVAGGRAGSAAGAGVRRITKCECRMTNWRELIRHSRFESNPDVDRNQDRRRGRDVAHVRPARAEDGRAGRCLRMRGRIERGARSRSRHRVGSISDRTNLCGAKGIGHRDGRACDRARRSGPLREGWISADHIRDDRSAHRGRSTTWRRTSSGSSKAGPFPGRPWIPPPSIWPERFAGGRSAGSPR